MRLITSILLGKSIATLTKLFNFGGGSAAPGLYALKVNPSLVSDLSKQIKKNVVITGTNGKTTTSRMLAHFARSARFPAKQGARRAKEAGLKVIRNHTGSNLERGIASTLIQNSSFHPNVPESGNKGVKLNYDLGIWELDEAAFNSVAPKLNPDVVVFLNVFRDQLDRYGEIDTVVKKWCETLENLPARTQVLVNGDDQNTLKLAKCFKGKVKKFGVKDYKIPGESVKHREEKGSLDFEAKNVKLNGLKETMFDLKIENWKLKIVLPLPGLYHIYDALAAIGCATLLNLPTHRLTDTLKHFSPAFGRVEKLPFGYIFLIKNPAGATQVFETIAPNIKPNDRLLLALNDNLADGTDVSWIWDGEFEKLKVQSEKLKVFCSGSRAYDLALRLKYAGIEPKNLVVQPDLKKALKQAREGLKGSLFILPTYTAMLELQSILVKSGIKKQYWKEEI